MDLQEHEILLKVHVPFTRQHEFVKEFKQAHRRDDDIAIVNAGMSFQMGQAEGEQRVLAVGIRIGDCVLLAACGGGFQMGRAGGEQCSPALGDDSMPVMSGIMAVVPNAVGPAESKHSPDSTAT